VTNTYVNLQFPYGSQCETVLLKTRPQGITFHWDNTPSHTAKVTIAKITELGMNQMLHPPFPPCSPDIASCDFFLFGNWKHEFQGCFYDSADELFSAITDLMENLEK
jgi:hypothetical protein